MKMFQIIILGIFTVWWCSNFFFNLPDSSLPIVQNFNLYKKWDGLFYQRWGFFAPPPDYDDRLYYVYADLKDSTKVTAYEVFENIHIKRKKLYPFDDELSTLDYILHNLASPIGDLIREGYDIHKIHHNCDSLEENSGCFQKYIGNARDDFNNSPNLTSLMKHAKIIAGLKNIKNTKVQIILGAIELPKFKDRYKKDLARKEYPFFKSNYYNLKTNKWEKFHE